MVFESIEREIRLSNLLEALEADDTQYSNTQRNILDQIFKQLKDTEDSVVIENNIDDMVDISNLYYYAQGMKMGAHLAKILCL